MQILPVQTTIGDSFHCVKVAVRPIDPLCDNIYSNSSGSTKSVLHQLHTVTAIHEGTFQFYFLTGIACVCEEHVAANKQRKERLDDDDDSR